MITIPARHKLNVAIAVYWIILLYIIIALVYWFIALQTQNNLMASMRLVEIKKDDPAYLQKVEKIEDARKRKTAQYIGEGTTFLALIMIGAVFVFGAVRRQIKLSQQQQNFMMAITHELKTPIAVTRLNLETLQKRRLEEEKQQKLISNTLQETNRLNTLCNNILLAAQLESNASAVSKQEINFSELVEGCVEDFINRYPQRKITAAIDESMYVNGEELMLQMLVNNLIDNALKYSPKDGLVNVLLKEEKDSINLQVIDEGIGIADAEKKKVFDKFYRTGNENVRTTKGTGLGLFLTKKIMQGHNGYISVTDNQPRGSIFTASFKV